MTQAKRPDIKVYLEAFVNGMVRAIEMRDCVIICSYEENDLSFNRQAYIANKIEEEAERLVGLPDPEENDY